MVTKLNKGMYSWSTGLILAKIHMVTKHKAKRSEVLSCLILAKIHMVTKLISNDL